MNTPTQLDPALFAVLANRFDSIVREMTSTLIRTGHSTVLSVARDLSCSLVTADDQLLSAVEGITVHVFGSQLQTAAMRRLHPELREGDAYLDNDPYEGNTHAADHSILIPVFWQDRHVFTVCAKAHQADVGNSIPSTYHPLAQDVYEEGALIFPMVQVQNDYRDVDDIIRMCRSRIRVPDQWYGDYLAMVAAARVGERRLKEVIARYGMDTIAEFVGDWLDYSERRAQEAIEQMPSGSINVATAHDAFEGMPGGIPVTATVSIDAEAGTVSVDLRDNAESMANGMNQSRTCAINNAVTGVFNALGPDVPVNSGAFRRVEVLVRDGSILAAQHPVSCSVATTNLADRLINLVTFGLSQLGHGLAAAEGGLGMGPAFGVIAGVDERSSNPYVNSIIMGCNGGPATTRTDGWLTYATPVGAGVTQRDSVELAELRYPLVVHSMTVARDSGGAGQHRGAPGVTTEYGTRFRSMSISYMLDGEDQPARGVDGGRAGSPTRATLTRADGTQHPLPRMGQITIEPGDVVRTENGGGGGYGQPQQRDPQRVANDVRRSYLSAETAQSVYGVAMRCDGFPEQYEVDTAETEKLRSPN